MKEIKRKDEVERFLKQFLPKLDILGIIYIDREKTDIASWGDMWVSGKDAYDKEIYIKITLGQPNSKTICISFHESEYKIDYAFKKQKRR